MSKKRNRLVGESKKLVEMEYVGGVGDLGEKP